MALSPLYVFIDEAGDFNFSQKGTKVYTLTAVISHNPWEVDILTKAYGIRHNILAGVSQPQLGQKYLEEHLSHRFHASEDQQCVRDEFFKIISKMKYVKAHAIVVKKNRANPSITNPKRFYSMVVSSLLDYIFKSYQYSKLCIFIDSIPVTKEKEAFLKAVKSKIKLKQPNKQFSIYFPPSASNLYLQISDYINWAIFKKWESNDDRSYNLISRLLGRKELDMFARGSIEYYHYKK